MCVVILLFGLQSYLWQSNALINPLPQTLLLKNDLSHALGLTIVNLFFGEESNVNNNSCTAKIPDLGLRAVFPGPDYSCGDSMFPVKVLLINDSYTYVVRDSIVITVNFNGPVFQQFTYTSKDTIGRRGSDLIHLGYINSHAGGVFNIHAYISSKGSYDRSNDTLTYSANITPHEVVAPDVVACGNTANLKAININNSYYEWYDALVGGNLVGTGNTFPVPSISNQSTYYVQYEGMAQDTFSTLFTGGIWRGGCMIDIKAAKTIRIDSFDLNIMSYDNEVVEVYYKTAGGSHRGYTGDPASWTLLDTQVVQAVGAYQPTRVNIGGLTIAAGEIEALYITLRSSNLTVKVFTTPIIPNNSDIIIDDATGVNYLFSYSIFTRRVPDIHIYYTRYSCSDIRTPVTAYSDTAVQAAYTQNSNLLQASFADQSAFGPRTWYWDFGDGDTSTLQNPIHNYDTAGVYPVCMIASNECEPDTICHTVTITCPEPGAAFSTNINLLEATFSDLTIGVNVSKWIWDFGDGDSAFVQNPVHKYHYPKTYTVCLTVFDSCGSDFSCSNIDINCPLPTASFTHAHLGNNVSFTNTSSVSGSTDYFWDFGDGNTSSALNPTHSYSDGTYTACLSVSDECDADSACQTIMINTVGLDDQLDKYDFRIYPNPAQNSFVLETELANNKNLSVELVNTLGQVLLSENEMAYSGLYRQHFDIKHLDNGIYILRLTIDNKSNSYKLIKN